MTAVKTVPLMVVVPPPPPLFVIVPVLFMLALERVIVPVLVALVVIFPVPLIAPLIVMLFATGEISKLCESVIPPLKLALLFVLVIVAVPLLPDGTEIGLAKVTAPAPVKTTFDEPVVLPKVIVPPLPKDAATAPVTVPV